MLHSRDEEVIDLPRFDEIGKHRFILGPLLQNGRFTLSVPIHIALLEGQISIAGEIVCLSSSHPSSGVIDWHDLEVSHMESSWFDIPGITHLVYIGLSSNKLRCLPHRVISFTSLQKLQIHHNCINHLPAELFNMQNLKVIDASFNKLASLPEMLQFPLSPSLENLNFAHNRLTDLPSYFINSKIVILDISSNRFSKVPDCVVDLHRLCTLCLDYNVGIEFIPYEIGNLRNLSVLSLKGLPYLKNIPYKKDVTISPLEFLKVRARAPQSFCHYDVSLIADDSYGVCRDVMIQSIQQHSRRKHYSFIVYSSTQQFLNFQQAFSLPCSIYLILWDCEGGQNADELFPIISHLMIYSPNARIIVAACWMSAITPSTQTVTQDKINNSIWNELERKGILTILTVCVDKDALVSRSNSLQYLTEILHRRGEVSAVHLNVPNSYAALQSMLKKHATKMKDEGLPPMIDEHRLWDLIRECQHNDLAGHRELQMLVAFLTDVAFIRCLPSNRNSESSVYVLNRQWFLDALSGLLKPNDHVRTTTGLYPTHCLCDLLSCPSLQYDLPYAFFLFVNQLGLAIGVTSTNVLVPAMLSSSIMETSSDFSSQFDIRRIYTFSLVPQSFWSRLIAHLLFNVKNMLSMTATDGAGEIIDGIKFLSDSIPGEDQINWTYCKEGMVVYVAGSSLLFSIEAIQPIRQPKYCEGIEIRVCNNPVGTRAMNMIITTINSLLRNWYKELWQTVEISVPCPRCIKSDRYTLFPFHECCQSLVTGIASSLYCPAHQEYYSAISLVPDLVQSNGQTMFTSKDLVSFSVDDKMTCVSPPPSETVFKGKFGSMDVAVKPFPPPVPNGERSSNPFLDFWYEYTILSHISSAEPNPYIIDLLVSVINPLALVFPYARFCSLDEVIQERQIELPTILRIRFLYQLAHALEHLHSIKLIHRNVCLANIFVFSLSLDDTINVKLGGFSDSCIALNQGLAIEEYGTFPAPEMSKYGYQYDERVDVFAYAFVSYEILLRRKLKFRRGVRFQAASSSADRPPLNTIGKLAPHLATIIEKCWDIDESKRPFFGEIITTFRNPLHVITREGEGINELQDYNAATVRFTRQQNGSFKGDLYLCTSILSVVDSASLAHLNLPGLMLQESIRLPSRYIVCMCCTAQYLWISFKEKYVRIYSTENLSYVQHIDFEHFVVAMAISPDAVYLGLDNGEVQMYKMSNPSPLHSPHKTRIISYKKSIDSIQVLEDCIICCTQRSCIRIHPETLVPEQEFPVLAETPVKLSVLCLNRVRGDEYLWVSFKRLQQLVVFNALTGNALYGINTCEILERDKNDVWVTSMLSVLDTVWVGMNTGHILIFHAFGEQPHLLTYFKLHTEKVDKLMLLQPAYWGVNAPNYYYESLMTDSEDGSEDGEEHNFSISFEAVDMPHSMLVMSCGRGIEQRIPKIGTDGAILLDNNSLNGSIGGANPTPRLHLVMMDAPDSAGAHKLECQAHRQAVPYMDNYKQKICDFSDSSMIGIPAIPLVNSSSHRTIPYRLNVAPALTGGNPLVSMVTTPEIRNDSAMIGYDVISSRDAPPTDQLPNTYPENVKPLRKLTNLFRKDTKDSSSNQQTQDNTQKDIETTGKSNTPETTSVHDSCESSPSRSTDSNHDSDSGGKYDPYVSMTSVKCTTTSTTRMEGNSIIAICEKDMELRTSLP